MPKTAFTIIRGSNSWTSDLERVDFDREKAMKDPNQLKQGYHLNLMPIKGSVETDSIIEGSTYHQGTDLFNIKGLYFTHEDAIADDCHPSTLLEVIETRIAR